MVRCSLALTDLHALTECSLFSPGRHPGSTLQTLCVYGKNRPTGPEAPAAVHNLGSHGHSRNQCRPAFVSVWVGGSPRLDPPGSVTLSVALVRWQQFGECLFCSEFSTCQGSDSISKTQSSPLFPKELKLLGRLPVGVYACLSSSNLRRETGALEMRGPAEAPGRQRAWAAGTGHSPSRVPHLCEERAFPADSIHTLTSGIT